MRRTADIINEFDPLDLLPYAPPDEYKKEIKEIDLFLENNKDCNVEILAYKIYEIFIRSLGKDIFCKSIQDCYAVASALLKNIEKN